MNTDAAFWRDLAAQFRSLPAQYGDLKAVRHDGGQWTVYRGPEATAQRERLQREFKRLARTAAITAGVPNRANALSGWLELLRRERLLQGDSEFKRSGRG